MTVGSNRPFTVPRSPTFDAGPPARRTGEKAALRRWTYCSNRSGRDAARRELRGTDHALGHGERLPLRRSPFMRVQLQIIGILHRYFAGICRTACVTSLRIGPIRLSPTDGISRGFRFPGAFFLPFLFHNAASCPRQLPLRTVWREGRAAMHAAWVLTGGAPRRCRLWAAFSGKLPP